MVEAIKVYLSLLKERLLSIAKYICKSLRFVTPYFTLLYLYRYGFTTGAMIVTTLIPIMIWVTTSVIDIYLNIKGYGSKFPVPDERFTEDAGDGEIRVRNDRIQEMILYVYKVENWLIDKGFTI